MSISSLNIKFSNKNNFELSKIEKCNIDSGIHIYFNFIKQWKTYKLDECHIQTLLLKISTITHEEEYYIIDLIKHQILDQQLVIKELKINNHDENELVTELKIKTCLLYTSEAETVFDLRT